MTQDHGFRRNLTYNCGAIMCDRYVASDMLASTNGTIGPGWFVEISGGSLRGFLAKRLRLWQSLSVQHCLHIYLPIFHLTQA